MNEHFELAEIEKNEKAQRKLEQLENELAKDIGGDVVLIAYKRNSKENWH